MEHVDNNILQIITGPMFSGKTTELRRRLSRYMVNVDNVMIINSSQDTREQDDVLSTHDKTIDIKLHVKKVSNLTNLMTTSEWENAKVIGIDEAQFFGKDIKNFVVNSMKNGKVCIIAGLISDINCSDFGYMKDLFNFATEIITLTAICKKCEKLTPASYTIRLTNTKCIIEVGGSDKYIPVCWKHYLEHQNEMI